MKYEAILEGSKKVTFTETVIVGRIFMAIENLRMRCQVFNSVLQKTKKRVDNAPKKKPEQVQEKSKENKQNTERSPSKANHTEKLNSKRSEVTIPKKDVSPTGSRNASPKKTADQKQTDPSNQNETGEKVFNGNYMFISSRNCIQESK